MARDIHDTLAQGFTGVIMQLEAAKGATKQGNLAEAANRIERASDLARSSLGELKQFGIDVVVASAGNMKTGGPEKTAAALARVASGMTTEQRALYGQTFGTFTAALNGMQNSGLDSASAARRVIELAEQVPAPIRAAVGQDSEEILKLVHEKSDAELDALRLQLVGLK